MNVNNKFIYARTKDSFLQILPTIPQGLNPIVFIEDSKQIWTCGTYFSMGDVELKVSEIDGSIKVNVGNDSFFLSTSGEALSIRKGDRNSIVITSSALTKLNTDTVLKWDAVNKKISHSQTAVKIGKYGPGTNETDVSIITVPNFTVDQYGHLIEAGEVNVKIRDYVNQLAASEDNVYRPVLLSYGEGSDEASTSGVRKANGLEYNDASGNLKLSKGGIEVSEDVVTRLNLYGDNEMTIRDVNFGNTFIQNFAYFKNTRFMSQSFFCWIKKSSKKYKFFYFYPWSLFF